MLLLNIPTNKTIVAKKNWCPKPSEVKIIYSFGAWNNPHYNKLNFIQRQPKMIKVINGRHIWALSKITWAMSVFKYTLLIPQVNHPENYSWSNLVHLRTLVTWLFLGRFAYQTRIIWQDLRQSVISDHSFTTGLATRYVSIDMIYIYITLDTFETIYITACRRTFKWPNRKKVLFTDRKNLFTKRINEQS